MIESIDILYFVGFIFMVYLTWEIFNRCIFPQMVYHGMKELERNPKWVTSRLPYYGFGDIDIVVCESKWGMLPRFRLGKNNKFELLIDNDTRIEDAEDIGRLALVGKLKAKYNIWFPEKPIYWLSILCYMLDGGDIQMSSVSWEEAHKRETK